MKKKDWLILGILACIITGMVFWYEYTHLNPEPPVAPDYEEYVADDAVLLASSHPASVFFESTIVLDSVGEIAEVQNVFQSNDTCIIFHHEGQQLDVEEINDYWLEDVVMDIPLPMTLDSAITLYNASEYAAPITTIVARNPLGPEIGNPRFIFGTVESGFVSVDMVTSEVSPIQ